MVPSGRWASSSTATIPGWSRRAVSRASRRNRFRAATCLSSSFVGVLPGPKAFGESSVPSSGAPCWGGTTRCLSATSRATNSSKARTTTDWPPRPSSSRRRYWPARSSGPSASELGSPSRDMAAVLPQATSRGDGSGAFPQQRLHAGGGDDVVPLAVPLGPGVGQAPCPRAGDERRVEGLEVLHPSHLAEQRLGPAHCRHVPAAD